jgi:hypothetical protein
MVEEWGFSLGQTRHRRCICCSNSRPGERNWSSATPVGAACATPGGLVSGINRDMWDQWPAAERTTVPLLSQPQPAELEQFRIPVNACVGPRITLRDR